jgi:hypothetical protein
MITKVTTKQFQFILFFIQRGYLTKYLSELSSFLNLKDYYSFCILAYYNQ